MVQTRPSSNTRGKRTKRAPSLAGALDPARILTDEAAPILGIKRRKLQAMAQDAKIPGAAKIGRQWTFDPVKLRNLIEQQEEETQCQRNVRHRPGVTGAVGLYGGALKFVGGSTDGRLKQMIQQSQKRVARLVKPKH